MKDAAIIEKHGIERIGKRELTQRSSLRGSKICVTPLDTLVRLTSITHTQSTPSLCAPSGVGIPVPLGVASMRN